MIQMGLAIFWAFVMCNMTITATTNDDKIRAVRVVHPAPEYDQKMKLTVYDTIAVSIYYYKDMVAYAIPVYDNVFVKRSSHNFRYLVH
ncbi:hypothetical protein GA0116948_110124 [Chitinophaga costaii]|uniref:Uncharacterized protein n=1 Tax=Chitinophaga costaii TaxID=1335309 RepID=A0A1C4EYY5_9BACT|nr:hypothetical protein GA0116948_110124 [Chitinophaga costaii]